MVKFEVKEVQALMDKNNKFLGIVSSDMKQGALEDVMLVKGYYIDTGDNTESEDNFFMSRESAEERVKELMGNSEALV